MTELDSREVLEPVRPRVSRIVAGEAITSDQFSQWLVMRREFMERMGWHAGDDYDKYDADEGTIQLLQLEQGRVCAGMRLTPRRSIGETLSVSMLPQEVGAQLPPELLETGPVWDLTRLVSEQPQDIRAALISFGELFGVGLGRCLEAGDMQPRWVFSTTRGFYDVLSHFGIEFSVLSDSAERGVRARGDTLFCEAYPVDRTQFLSDNKDTYPIFYQAVMRGLQQDHRGAVA